MVLIGEKMMTVNIKIVATGILMNLMMMKETYTPPRIPLHCVVCRPILFQILKICFSSI